MTTATIHDITTATSYVARSSADCRDAVDRSAYESAVELNDVVSMGCVVVQLFSGDDPTLPEAA